MAIRLAPSPRAQKTPRSRRLRWPFLLGFGLVTAVLLLATAVVELSGASLAGDPAALAQVHVQAFGGALVSARALDPHGRAIPLLEDGGRLTPREKLAPGTRVTVEVTTRRPGWDAWLIGKTRTERLTITAPVAHVTSQWVTGAPVRLAFDQPVTSVDYGGKLVAGKRDSLSVTPSAPAGTLRVAVAARTWEMLGRSQAVHYFPAAKRPVALVSPAPGGRLDPGAAIRITLSKPVAKALGSAKPRLSPSIPGHWRSANDHTLTFTPSGSGAPLGSHVKLTLGHTVAAADPSGHGVQTTRELDWTVPSAQPLRVVQMLADLDYLPVEFKPDAGKVAPTARAQATAAADPPKGRFTWRYKNTPKELKSQWQPPLVSNVIVRGAIMKFQDQHGMTADGLAGPDLWKALQKDELAGKRQTTGYSYVYVHRNIPQLLTLWHNGHVVLTSPGNTGVPAAPTDLGTFPVFEHLAVTTMSGTNPDGSHYNDPGIPWVSYFNGGDALHAFPRASFGTPQSLGCVELPLAAAKKIWPYTPIGTLVTIED